MKNETRRAALAALANAPSIAAAELVRQNADFLHGSKDYNAECAFGLPYTSGSGFAAIWNTNAEAKAPSRNCFFDGVAIDETGAPVIIWTETDNDGNELRTIFEKIPEYINGFKATRADLLRAAHDLNRGAATLIDDHITKKGARAIFIEG